MGAGLRLLLVDDEKEYRELLQLILKREGYPTDVAESGQIALEMIDTNEYDVVLTDMRMEGVDGLQVLEYINSLNRSIKCIVITAYASVENAVAAMKMGAFSYFIKSNDPQELICTLRNIGKIKSLSEENKLLKEEIGNKNYLLKSKSSEFQKIVSYAEKVAETDANVLILGESGVGKEVLARHIYQSSPRKNAIFMTVNCHSLSDSLLEAELYGHEKGAFTGAMSKRVGRFEAADKGVLFLDEIGDIPLSTQSKLLRNIENKEIERIGSNQPIKVDYRLICATNKDLKREILEGTFREDLYYRVSTIIIEVPPLRKRKEDLPMLIDFFLMKAGKELKKHVSGISEDLLEALFQYDYPGNVRELKNIIERMVVIAEKERLTLQDVNHYDIFSRSHAQASHKSLREVRSLAERNHILQTLKECEFDMDEAAKILQITTRQLYNKTNEYKISRFSIS